MPKKSLQTLFLYAFFIGNGPLYSTEAPPTSVSNGVTLLQCYQWANETSEDLKIQTENIEQSKTRARAAFGDALPDIKWQFNETWQQPSGVKELENRGFSGFVEKNQTESKFTLDQPLFSGLREFSAMSGFKKESLAHQLERQRAQAELYDHVAMVFYKALNSETDFSNTQAILDIANNRVKELKNFMRLGKSRKSEVSTAEAYSASLKGKLDHTRASIGTARAELSYLTGRDLDALPLIDEISDQPSLEPLPEALAAAQNRTDINAQKQEVEAMQLRVRYEQGSFWPKAYINGNYYTKRATFLSAIDWDVLLGVDVPLFQGGIVSSRVREARSSLRQSILSHQRLQRFVQYSVKKIYAELTAAIQETNSLREATQSAEQSYLSLRKEYELGLVTNLDVMQALNFLQEQKSALDAARYNVKQLYVQLNVAMEKFQPGIFNNRDE